MKKIFLLTILAVLSFGAFAQTGAGWDQIRRKENFKDSVYFQKAVIFNNDAIFNDSTNISTIVPLLVDTIPLVTFGAGSAGLESDTALFTLTTVYGSFWNGGSDTLVITELRAVMLPAAGNDTLDLNICWADTLLAVINTKLNTTALPINSSTVGTVDTSFNNPKIPPQKWVWCITPAFVYARRPQYLSVTLSGYKIPKY